MSRFYAIITSLKIKNAPSGAIFALPHRLPQRGPQYVFRAGFGFLLGFLAAAFVIGLLTERLPRFNDFVRLMIAAVAGLVIYYLIGIAYYYFMYSCVLETPAQWGLGIAIAGCMTTFLPDLALCAIAAALSIRLRPALRAAMSQ